MTVETIIAEMQLASAAQVAASQDLSSEVAGKMGDIDSKVGESISQMSAALNQLSQDVSGVINSAMAETVYVSLNGSDTNSGTTAASPVETIDKALKLIPEGGVGIIKLVLVKDDQEVSLVYPVDTLLDVGSKNILLCSYDGTDNGIKVFQGGEFKVRSGGSLKFGNPHNFNIYIDADRTSDTLVYGYGGSVQLGGYYTVRVFNDSPSLKSIVKSSYHTGDSRLGVSSCFAGFCRVDTTGSTAHGFALTDGYLSCFIILNAWTCVMDAETLLYSSNLKALQVPESGAYLLSM